MTLTVATILAVTVLAAINLVLTLGVVHRLREHTEQLSRLASRRAPTGEPMIEVGQQPGDFSAATVEGDEITRTRLAGPALVGFFMPNCAPCDEWLPRFVHAATSWPSGRERVLAVVVGDAEAAAGYIAALRVVARVVVERSDGPVARAFAVHGYPVLCRLSERGTVVSNDRDAVVTEPLAA